MYYPKSQVKTNLYTNGGEYTLQSTQEFYQGYYYETSTGQKFTGKTPQSQTSIQLFPPKDYPIDTFIQSSPENLITTQDDLSNGSYPLTPPVRSIPQFNPTSPTPQTNQNGQFYRYFCKKSNELIYLEIDQNTYKKLQAKDPQIAWDLYIPSQVLWMLTGPLDSVYNQNKSAVQLIEQNLKWLGFSQHFRHDFAKYYLGS